MTFATPLGLLALLGVPVVLFLHLFRRRLRTRRVAGLFLWAPDRIAADAGRTRTRLLRSPSLWLEVAAATLLGLWLAGPSFGVGEAAPHLVVVLDDSASMDARVDGASTAEHARDAVRALLDDLPASARATLVLTGRRPSVACGPRAPLALFRDALRDWRPRRPDHAPNAALHLGAEIAGADGRLHYVSDRLPGAAPERFAVTAVGRPATNAAVLAARRADGRLYFDLVAFGSDVETELTLSTPGGATASRVVSLPAGRPVHVALADPAPRRAVTLRLADDALAIDNEVTLLPPPPRTVAVAALLDEKTRALLALEDALAALPDVSVDAGPAAAHLRFTAAAGQLAPGRVEVVIAAPGAERDDWIGPFLIERRHPLLAGLTLDGVVWSAAPRALPGLPIVLAGDQPLVSVEGDDDGLRVFCNLDPARSNLPASPDWPIFLLNLVEYARERLPGPVDVNTRLGEPLRYRHDGGADAARALVLVDPSGVRLPARGVRLLTWDTRAPGIHTLRGPEGARARFSVQFADARESDLSGARADVAPATVEPARAGAGEGEPERRLLALLLLACVVADWLWLGRRR